MNRKYLYPAIVIVCLSVPFLRYVAAGTMIVSMLYNAANDLNAYLLKRKKARIKTQA